ncbi:MAG: bifunctional diaminohydroxyphosphoribosylaminopyrimidine deaminase/5-amino-6-(5-phosphoribosylamino)uracil reductase RibD [Gemmatimonadota bacterium]
MSRVAGGSGSATREEERHVGADAAFMRRAVSLAERGWGRVSPNPLVGAVVVHDGRIVGEGYHAEYGGDHAEVVALREAGERASGATLYVTLEPCTHVGKTPPCTRAILKAGVDRVVVACRDPHPEAGGGVERLREAGVRVDLGMEEEPARRVNAAFLWWHAHATPFTALKLALSLDARLAARDGTRTAVSGEVAARMVHRLRAGFDAILVGGRTARVDDPLLTARCSPAPRRAPVRIVLDPELRLGSDSALLRSVEAAPLWLIATRGAGGRQRPAPESGGARVLRVSRGGDGKLDLRETWRRLGEEGLTSVLVEGGGRLTASLLREDLVQRLYLIIAPVFFGTEGVEGFPGLDPIARGEWRPVDRQTLGEDTLLILERSPSARAKP